MLYVSPVFGHHMVLQRQKPINIWGNASPGASIHIQLGQHRIQSHSASVSTRVLTAHDGHWRATLPPLEAGYDFRLTIDDGQQTLSFDDIAIGEVWLASGQSNMKYQVHFDHHKADILSQPDHPHIRCFLVPQISIAEMEYQFDYRDYNFWRRCNQQELPHFSSVAYYFARHLEQELNIPIGIIGCYWGGTPACAWLARHYLPGTAGEIWLTDYEARLNGLDLDQDKRHYLNDPNNDTSQPLKNQDGLTGKIMYPGLTESEQAILLSEKQAVTTRPDYVVGGPHHHCRPGGLYDMMLSRIAPYTLRGVIWYQGESDAPHPQAYYAVFSQLIQCWRDRWQDPLPFLFVQLAPFDRWLDLNGHAFPQIRQQQQQIAQHIPGTWMASSSDAGMETDIHPKIKRPIGQRLALLALSHIYGQSIQSQAPMFKQIDRHPHHLTICFDNADGLYLEGGEIHALAIEDEQGNPVPYQDVRIDQNALIVSGHFPSKVRIKFAMTPYYQVNLYNLSHIPALPFEISV